MLLLLILSKKSKLLLLTKKQRKTKKTKENKHEKQIKRIRIIAAVWYISCFWLFMQCFYCFCNLVPTTPTIIQPPVDRLLQKPVKIKKCETLLKKYYTIVYEIIGSDNGGYKMSRQNIKCNVMKLQRLWLPPIVLPGRAAAVLFTRNKPPQLLIFWQKNARKSILPLYTF